AAGQAPLIGQRPLDQAPDRLVVQRVQGQQHAAGQQRRDHREVRVLRGRREQRHGTVLDRRQQRILLGLAEPVYLVDEQDGRLTTRPAYPPGLVDDRADLLDPGRERGERHETPVPGAGDEVRDGGLAAARRSPQDHRHGRGPGDQLAQRRAGSQQVLLADELVEGTGTHPDSQGRVRPGYRETGRRPGRRGGGEREESLRVHRHRHYRPDPRDRDGLYGSGRWSASGPRSPAPGDGVPGQRREVQGDEQKPQRGEGIGPDERSVRLADQFEDERDGEDDRRDDREHGC